MAASELAELATRIRVMPHDPVRHWHDEARKEQRLPGGDWRVWYLQGGRGSGKTRSGAGALAEWIRDDWDPGQWGIIAPTYRDAWTVCVEGESGILRALGTSAGEVKNGTSKIVQYAHRSYGEIGLRTGHVIYVDSADDGALRVQGKNLRGIWGDEIGLWVRWQTAYNESIRYAVRRGISRIILTGTPKASRPARALIRSLIRNEPEHGGVVITRLRTVDNAANLSDAFMRSVVGAAKGTRLERQELEGELLDDVANALWTRDLLESVQHPGLGTPDGPQFLMSTVIGVDPSDGAEDSDEQAYTIAGMGPPDDHHLYVAENWGGQMAPAPFTRLVIRKAVAYNAKIVVEKNHGGAWLQSTFAMVAKEMDAQGLIPEGRKPQVQMIHASQAKRTRAEPVSAMYERNGGQLVRHAGGPFVELEDQMATFTGAQGERSPDRLDSLVWALSPFLAKTFGPPVPGGVRQWAAAREIEKAAEPEGGSPEKALQRMRQRRLTGVHGGIYDRRDWSDESFAPADLLDGQEQGPRGNVIAWDGGGWEP